ncbi:MAG: hypothetical protein AAFY34_04515 [Pseudomonadota bacterium]
MEYNANLAGQLVTLAAIANAEVGKPIPTVHNAIIEELAKPNYATGARWSLVWGPVLGHVDDNMLYVARLADSSTYAVVLRGTVMTSISSMWEDVPKGQSVFPYANIPGATVSTPYLHAVEGMLSATDEVGVSLQRFLADEAAKTHGMIVHVCGHSQGGGLVAMVLAWLIEVSESWTNSGETLLSAYASAGPGAGNPVFANWFGENANFFQIINPLDTIPLWYGSILETLTRNIPEPLGHSIEDDTIRLAIKGWADVARLSGPWAQPETVVPLSHIQLPPSVSYIDQAQNQHHHNSYLYLMGVPQVDCTPATILPQYGPPVPPADC